jgi:alpha-N-arabinofuranosidase
MNRIIVKPFDADERISRHIYGHFSEHLGRCIYGGFWVGNDPEAAAAIPNTRGLRDDVVAALRKIRIPALRWPGGCFADEYHWEDGIGPREGRPRMINTHWGGVTEDNSFGTHEFLDLCGQLSDPAGPRCEPYICGNVGSGTVRELSQWVEYCNFDGTSPMADLRAKNGRKAPWGVKFWGIGNESWGCGGNMTAEFYADNYRRYATYVRNYGEVKPYKIACGPNTADYHWTEVLMDRLRCERGIPLMDALSLHYYTVPGEWGRKGQALVFDEAEWYLTMSKTWRMEELLSKHSAIMDKTDPGKRVAIVVDEWGCWYDVEPGTNPGFLFQQNTLRDALAAAINFNIFNNHCSRVRMANIAQTINVLQAVILTQGPQMILTPTYHAFDLYKVHQDALKLPVYVECPEIQGAPAITASASEDSENRIHISVTNIDLGNEAPVEIDLRGCTVNSAVKVSGAVLSAASMNAYNHGDDPSAVTPEPFDAGTCARIGGGKLTIILPPKSAATIELTR